MAETFANQIASLATRIGTECKTLHDKVGVLTSLKTTDKASAVAAINEVLGAANKVSSTVDSLGTRLSTAESKIGVNEGNITTAQQGIATLQGNVATITQTLEDLKTKIENKSQIDDAKTELTSTWSSSKISSEMIAAKKAVKDELLGGAGEAFDTLQELATLISTNGDAIKALQELAVGHVKFDGPQELTGPQKKQACDNIGAVQQSVYNTLVGRVDAVEKASPQLQEKLTAVEQKANTTQAELGKLKTSIGDIETSNFVAAFEGALTPGK